MLISLTGHIASDLAVGAEGIKKLVDRVHDNGQGTVPGPWTRQPKLTPGHALSLGEPVPAFSLVDLQGRAMTGADLRGSPTLLLFWNPNCGFCANMLEDVRQLEAARDESQARLVFVSTGTPEANKAMNLRSRILIESGFRLGAALGLSGTPSAVLVDSHGKISSAVAVGASAVLGLAQSGLESHSALK